MLRKALLMIVAGAAALAFGASSSKAAEVFFGTLGTPAGCVGPVLGQEGAVCPNNETFTGTAAGDLTATAFSGAPGTTSETFLTFKAVPPNAVQEGGLGENGTPPGSAGGCTDAPDCEIAGLSSVAITSSVPLNQADVFVGSVQSGEDFNVWAGDAPGTLVEVASGLTVGSAGCGSTGFPDSCLFTLATPATTIAIQDAVGVGGADILVTAVSTSVPEPASLALLGTALVGLGGVMRRRRRHNTV